MFFLSFRLGTSSLLQNISYLHICTMYIYVNSLYSEEGSKYRVESSIKNIFQSGEHLSILINMPGLQIFKHIYIYIYIYRVKGGKAEKRVKGGKAEKRVKGGKSEKRVKGGKAEKRVKG